MSEAAVNYLQPLKHNPDAQRHCSMIPLGGIYWDDEIPEFSKLMTVPKDDRDAIFRLFSIRFKLWAGDELDADDQAYWDAALEWHHQFVNYFFSGTVISEVLAKR